MVFPRRKAQGCCGHDSGGYSLHRHSPSALVSLFYFSCSGAGKCTSKNAYPFIGRKQYFYLILVVLNLVVDIFYGATGRYPVFIYQRPRIVGVIIPYEGDMVQIGTGADIGTE